MRQFRSPSRWAWLLPVSAVALAVACDNSLQGINRQDTWGFVLVSATRSGDAHFTAPEGLFFKGNLASVPNSDFAIDTCADGVYSEGNNLSGVTYLDAGVAVQAVLSGTTNSLLRTSTASGLSYLLETGPTSYTPGDTIYVSIPGAEGGFPAGTIKAKTAEPFTFPTVELPQGTETIQLNWSQPQGTSGTSSMIVSLRYKSGGSTSFNRHVLCTFVDDGVDSIPFRWYQNWAAASSEREVVATRLRTTYVSAGAANLGVISTYEVPTPPNNP